VPDPASTAIDYFAWHPDQASIEIFTTRPDTLYGASFIALSPDHPLSQAFAKGDPTIQRFREQCTRTGTSEEIIEKAEKIGLDTGLRVAHPFEAGKTLPVWIANFVLMGYGTGAIFGCPAHDQRRRMTSAILILPANMISMSHP